MARPVKVADTVEVLYDEKRWTLFRQLRQRARDIMLALSRRNVVSIVHGSVARGDVDRASDVDIFVPSIVQSYEVELALDDAGFVPIEREIVVATPWQLPKAHIYLDKNCSVTFPLTKPKRLEVEFYYFGGAIDLRQVEREIRAAGVDKRLMLIEPTPQGHVESQVIGREAEVAKQIGVGQDIVRERVQVLTRRSDVGHTGVFIERKLAPDEGFEAVMQQLLNENPEMKIRLRGK
ncbi:MAG: DNA polymerase subunit beta [Hadesarchaea archaeon CG08_land_8_20_14_0_20_51_8]|nr:MAG: DNA polymerase subunit beta [Hadesarchaea archaeon CG08_land_8_20_14_0_20_51_8]